MDQYLGLKPQRFIDSGRVPRYRAPRKTYCAARSRASVAHRLGAPVLRTAPLLNAISSLLATLFEVPYKGRDGLVLDKQQARP
jgi:hypothetical protein